MYRNNLIDRYYFCTIFNKIYIKNPFFELFLEIYVQGFIYKCNMYIYIYERGRDDNSGSNIKYIKFKVF